jgi:hypothetical protein
MHLSIKKIDQIAVQQFKLAYLNTEELLDIQNEVLNCYKLKMHQEFAQENIGLQFYVNNVVTGLKIMLPFSIITSLILIATVNASPGILLTNTICAIGGLTAGTAIFGFVNTLINRYKEKKIIMNKLYEVLANIDYQKYKEWLKAYSQTYIID